MEKRPTQSTVEINKNPLEVLSRQLIESFAQFDMAKKSEAARAQALARTEFVYKARTIAVSTRAQIILPVRPELVYRRIYLGGFDLVRGVNNNSLVRLRASNDQDIVFDTGNLAVIKPDNIGAFPALNFYPSGSNAASLIQNTASEQWLLQDSASTQSISLAGFKVCFNALRVELDMEVGAASAATILLAVKSCGLPWV